MTSKNIISKIKCGIKVKPFVTLLLLIVSFCSTTIAQIRYVENLGQWENNILYRADLSGGYLFAEKDRITFVVSEADKIHDHHLAHTGVHIQGDNEDDVFGSFSYQVEFLDANLNPEVIANQPSSAYHNYFNHSDQSKWRSNVNLYANVEYHEIYDGIDLALYSKDNLFEYDFVIKPGANIDQIKLKYLGIDQLKIINGQLHLYTPLGTLVELAPIVYQRRKWQ